MSKKRLSLLLKIEKFFKEELWQYTLFIATISFFAWVFNKPYEAVMFCLSHLVMRPLFEKQYHCKATGKCIITTLFVIFLGIYTAVPIKFSLLSAIPVSFLVCLIGYIAQDRVDCKKTIKELQHKDIWQMNEVELTEYCYKNGIRGDMIKFVVMVIVHDMKYREIAHELNYSIDTLKDWSPKCKKKLNIKNWKKEKTK